MRYRQYTNREVIALKNRQLDELSVSLVEHYLRFKPAKKLGYVAEVYQLFLSQLIIKSGMNTNTFPLTISSENQARLESLAERLTRHFLKRKLNRLKKPQYVEFEAGAEILDPHHHLNSIYVKDHPALLHLLPDFGAIYIEMRGKKRDSKREIELKSNPHIVTDVQFLGNPPRSSQHPSDNKKRLHLTVGHVRQNNADAWFVNRHIAQHAKKNGGVCHSCDLCGYEAKDSEADIEKYINHVLEHKAQIIRVHVGETHLPSHGSDNVILLLKILDKKRQQGHLTNQTIRLGHGTHMNFQSMVDCSRHGYYVEACLSSNKETGIIAKRKEYPLGLMLLLDVPVVLGTDGGDLYYTDLKTEYAYAKKVLNHFLRKIHQGSDEIIQLPNGDKLCYQYVRHLFPETVETKSWLGSKQITYKDLKLIEPICRQKAGIQTLVGNMNRLKERMFPGEYKEAVLADAKEMKLMIDSEELTDEKNISRGQSTDVHSVDRDRKHSSSLLFKLASETTGEIEKKQSSHLPDYQLEKIYNLIETLEKEIKSFWPYPNKARKQEKVYALSKLIVYAHEYSIVEAVSRIKSEFPNASLGNISTRTVDLLNSLVSSTEIEFTGS